MHGSGGQTRFSLFSLLYDRLAPSAEGQHQEAGTASIYGHFRESADLGVSVIKDLSSFVHIILFFK